MSLKEYEVCANADQPIISFSGVFDWQGLYRLLRGWFDEQLFDYTEKKHIFKGVEIEIELVGERKVDAMHKYKAVITAKGEGLQQVQGGFEGRIWIAFTGTVVVDYDDKFSQGRFVPLLGKWYISLMDREIKAKYISVLEKSLYAIHVRVKKFLNMETDIHAPR